jgi:hypothetical protein
MQATIQELVDEEQYKNLLMRFNSNRSTSPSDDDDDGSTKQEDRRLQLKNILVLLTLE